MQERLVALDREWRRCGPVFPHLLRAPDHRTDEVVVVGRPDELLLHLVADVDVVGVYPPESGCDEVVAAEDTLDCRPTYSLHERPEAIFSYALANEGTRPLPSQRHLAILKTGILSPFNSTYQ